MRWGGLGRSRRQSRNRSRALAVLLLLLLQVVVAARGQCRSQSRRGQSRLDYALRRRWRLRVVMRGLATVWRLSAQRLRMAMKDLAMAWKLLWLYQVRGGHNRHHQSRSRRGLSRRRCDAPVWEGTCHGRRWVRGYACVSQRFEMEVVALSRTCRAVFVSWVWLESGSWEMLKLGNVEIGWRCLKVRSALVL